MSVYTNVFSEEDILRLNALSEVMDAKTRLQQTRVVYFTIPLTPSLRVSLESKMGLDLRDVTEIPMRWIQGDTPHHVDVGASGAFENTYLVYLNDSEGKFVLGTNEYPITRNTAYVFNEGLEHKTQNTGSSPRLLVGPMNELAQPVGSTASYFANETDASTQSNAIGYTSNYIVIAINGVNTWNIASFSTGSTTGTVSAGDTLIADGTYYLYQAGPPPSNVCFPAKTPVLTDAHGYIHIDKLNPDIHTIRSHPIIAVTATLHKSDQLVSFAKNALGKNMPSETTIISPNHKIMWNGQMIKAKDFVNNRWEGISFIPYRGEVLYNVLLEKHGKMMVNNLVCETLDPENGVARLYRLLKTLSPEQQNEVLKHVSSQIDEKRKTR